MRPRLLGAVVLSLTVAAPAGAESGCGEMMRTMSRFRAKVLAVTPIGRHSVPLTEIDDDPRFVVTVQVESVREPGSPIRPGEIRHLGVRDLAETFGTTAATGTLDLETEWMECDGTFRRLVDLHPAPPRRIVEEVEGWIDVGHSYRAYLRWDEERDSLTFAQPISFPYHHDGGWYFTNVDEFPQIPRDGKAFPAVFEVVSVEISRIGEWHWLSMNELKLVDVIAK